MAFVKRFKQLLMKFEQKLIYVFNKVPAVAAIWLGDQNSSQLN